MVESDPILRDINAKEENTSSTRPKSFEDFIGQTDNKRNLSVFAEAAKQRNTAMDHVLFYGPPGLGKTTLAQIIAYELGVNFKSCLLYTSPSPRDKRQSRMPSSA